MGGLELAKKASLLHVGQSSEDDSISFFLLFRGYFGTSQWTEAMESLQKIDFPSRSDLYIAAAEIALKV